MKNKKADDKADEAYARLFESGTEPTRGEGRAMAERMRREEEEEYIRDDGDDAEGFVQDRSKSPAKASRVSCT